MLTTDCICLHFLCIYPSEQLSCPHIGCLVPSAAHLSSPMLCRCLHDCLVFHCDLSCPPAPSRPVLPCPAVPRLVAVLSNGPFLSCPLPSCPVLSSIVSPSCLLLPPPVPSCPVLSFLAASPSYLMSRPVLSCPVLPRRISVLSRPVLPRRITVLSRPAHLPSCPPPVLSFLAVSPSYLMFRPGRGQLASPTIIERLLGVPGCKEPPVSAKPASIDHTAFQSDPGPTLTDARRGRRDGADGADGADEDAGRA